MKLNLVTVVGDFHKDLTLTHMLRFYEKHVDEIYINYYRTERCAGTRDQLVEFLQNSGVYFPNVRIILHEGTKYDWDRVTNIYNNTTSLDKSAYWIISDCDEFQYWPESPRIVAMECERRGCTFVTGGFLDRVGPGGVFPEINGDSDLDQTFPLVGFFRYPISGACPNKVVMVKGGQKVCSGQHYAIFPDGSNSWGSEHPLRFPIDECFVQVHHFKWDSSILSRLDEVSKSGCKYSEEYLRMINGIRDSKHINVKDLKYFMEEFDPELGYDSYRHWNKVRNIIVKI